MGQSQGTRAGILINPRTRSRGTLTKSVPHRSLLFASGSFFISSPGSIRLIAFEQNAWKDLFGFKIGDELPRRCDRGLARFRCQGSKVGNTSRAEDPQTPARGHFGFAQCKLDISPYQRVTRYQNLDFTWRAIEYVGRFARGEGVSQHIWLGALGSGLHPQLWQIESRTRQRGIVLAMRGLHFSSFRHSSDPTSQSTPAFYIVGGISKIERTKSTRIVPIATAIGSAYRMRRDSLALFRIAYWASAKSNNGPSDLYCGWVNF